MELSKPKTFNLRAPIKIANAGLYGLVRFVVLLNTFPGTKTEVAVFDNIQEAMRMADDGNRNIDDYSFYTVEQIPVQ